MLHAGRVGGENQPVTRRESKFEFKRGTSIILQTFFWSNKFFLINIQIQSNRMLCYMQAGLEEKINQLLNEKENLSSKGVLILYFMTLFWYNDLFLIKYPIQSNWMLCYMQAGLEEKISQLLDERASLSSKGVLILHLWLCSGLIISFPPYWLTVYHFFGFLFMYACVCL